MENITGFFSLLGYKVQDVVTGFEGVATSLNFDLYGCVQAIVTPPINADEKKAESRWFDTKRLSRISLEPVMPVPVFAEPEERSFAAPRGGEDPPPFPVRAMP